MRSNRLSWRALFRSLIIVIPVLFVARLSYFVLKDLDDGRSAFLADRVFTETTAALLAAIPLTMWFWLARRMPLVRPVRAKVVAACSVCFVASTLAFTTAMIEVRALLAPLFGLDGYAADFRLTRYGYEAATLLVFFITAIGFLALAESVRTEQERERRSSELERGLLLAELSNLRLQLQPHFLFNALNTIASTMYEDVDAADVQLTQLAELLRSSLRTAQSMEVTVQDELAMLNQYLGLTRARFGDALAVALTVAPDVHELAVPSMLIQPIVENAIRHGAIGHRGRGEVNITLARRDDRLSILVENDVVPSLPPTSRTPSGRGERRRASGRPGEGGTGLSVTSRRLALLYPHAHTIRSGLVSTDRFEVEVTIPAR